MHDEGGQEWNQKSFQFIMCQITGKSSTATTGCTVRQYKNRHITISLVAALLVSIRKGSGWCISAFSSELQNLKDLSIYSTLLQCSRITWLGALRNEQTLWSLAKCDSSLQAAGLPHAPIWTHKNTEFSCHLTSSHPCVWNEGTGNAGLAPPLPSPSGGGAKLQRWMPEEKKTLKQYICRRLYIYIFIYLYIYLYMVLLCHIKTHKHSNP